MIGPTLEELESALPPLDAQVLSALPPAEEEAGEPRRRKLYELMKTHNSEAMVAGQELLFPWWVAYGCAISHTDESGQEISFQPTEFERDLNRMIRSNLKNTNRLATAHA